MVDAPHALTLEACCDAANQLVRQGRVRAALQLLEDTTAIPGSPRERFYKANWARQLRAMHPVAPRPGLVCFPAVDVAGVGGVFRVQVHTRRGSRWGCLERRFAEPIKAGVLCVDASGVGRAAFDFDLDTFAPAFDILPNLTSDAVDVRGQSFEGALALAVVSAAAQRPLDSRKWCITGAVEQGALRAVPADGLRAKQAIVALELGPAVALVSTRSDTPWPIEELARSVIGVLPQAPLDGSEGLKRLQQWMDEDAAFRDWSAAERIARAVLARPELDAAARLKATRYLAAALNHQGRAHEGLSAIEHVGESLDESADERARRIGGIAISHLDLDNVEAAIDFVEREIRGERNTTWERIQGAVSAVHLLGTLARCLSAAGRDAEAIHAAELAAKRAPPTERDRNLADLGFWLYRAGRLDEAAERLTEADEVARNLRPQGASSVSDQYRASFVARVAHARGSSVAETQIRAGLEHEPHFMAPVVFGWLEVALGQGLDVSAELARIDARFGEDYTQRNAIARLRARAELLRPEPDLGRVATLSGPWRVGESPADRAAVLRRRLPY